MTPETLNEKFTQVVMKEILRTWDKIYKSVSKNPITELHFIVKNNEIDRIMSDWFAGYEPGTMMVDVHVARRDMPHMQWYIPSATPGFFDTNDVTFYLYDEAVSAEFDDGIVSEDIDLPPLIEILREAIAQKTATPVFNLKEYTKKEDEP